MSKLGITRPTVIVDLCTDLDKVAEWERLNADLDEARRTDASGMLVGNAEARRLSEKITSLEQAMKDSTVEFTLRALTRKRWVELQAAHPAREGDEQDATFGVNVATFVDAAIAESIEKVVRKGDGSDVEFAGADWNEAADEMSNAQWNEFATKLFTLNNGVTAGPTSRAASRVMRSSETSSEQHGA